MLARGRRRRSWRLGAARRRARQRLLPGADLGPFRRHTLLQSGRLGPKGWARSCVAVRPIAARRGPRASRARSAGSSARSASRATACASSTSGTPRSWSRRAGRNLLIDPVWAERVGPLSLRRAQARQSAGHRLRRSAADRRRARHAQPLRPHGRGRRSRGCGSASARASSRRSATIPILRAAVPGLDAQTRVDWDDDGRSRRRSHRARRADTALVGARHRRSQPRAVGELRAARPGARKLYCVGDTGFGDGATFRRVRERHPRAGAGAPADRRLRAALVHAQQPHEPGRGGAGAGAVRARRRRSATTGARSASPTRPSSSRRSISRRARRARRRAGAVRGAAARRGADASWVDGNAS